jgi:Tol biopolymer transport system component
MKSMQRLLGMGLALLVTLLHGPVGAGEGEEGRVHYSGEDRLTHIRQLTSGGQNAEAVYSPLGDYRSLLAKGLVRPSRLEIFIMNLEERKPIQLTDNGAANFAPYWHPDGRHVIFVSNVADPTGRDFDLYLIEVDTREIERVTHFPGFDGFPMFSHDGKQLVFASNRNNKVRGEINVFMADWR